ncbi:DUF930 domain-containing protein [Bosea sp. 124]|uniref:DUF930 domain-containing protein n=1 Tax=Bosea sp. 124 TaxID=2135642 RepID=UPI0020C09FF6|nr:DUF930 domain-containing protein [Bosea sp. 124]
MQQEPDQGIEVELVTPEQIGLPAPMPTAEPAPPAAGEAPPAASASAAPAPASPPPAAPPAAPPAVPAAPVRVRARRLLSGEVLSNPHSRGTRDALARMDEAERIEQLCNLEAMGQIHAWKAAFEPDRVVAYAMGGTKLLKTTMQADAAAFRSKRQWYRLQFRCELTPDRKAIGGFEFMVGDPVPRDQWLALDLPEVH